MFAKRTKTKIRMVRYIRHLFELRSAMNRPNTWACVLRGRKLAVVRGFDVGLTDSVIMHRFLAPGEVPSWSLIYSVVTKRWAELVRADIESPNAATNGSLIVALSCVSPYSKVKCGKSIVIGF
jgi:hypothetical protein